MGTYNVFRNQTMKGFFKYGKFWLVYNEKVAYACFFVHHRISREVAFILCLVLLRNHTCDERL